VRCATEQMPKEQDHWLIKAIHPRLILRHPLSKNDLVIILELFSHQ